MNDALRCSFVIRQWRCLICCGLADKAWWMQAVVDKGCKATFNELLPNLRIKVKSEEHHAGARGR